MNCLTRIGAYESVREQYKEMTGAKEGVQLLAVRVAAGTDMQVDSAVAYASDTDMQRGTAFADRKDRYSGRLVTIACACIACISHVYILGGTFICLQSV